MSATYGVVPTGCVVAVVVVVPPGCVVVVVVPDGVVLVVVVPFAFTITEPVMYGCTKQWNMYVPAWEKLHVPLKVVAEELTGTPLQLGVPGPLLQTTPWAVPLEFLNATVPGAVSSTWEGFQQFT
jgi:hypothetical protein